MLEALAILVAAGAVMYTLVVRPKDVPPRETPSPFLPLEERKARIYENLRDLQFELRLGKMSDEDYQRAKQTLQQELAVVLAETDALKAKLAGSAK